MEKKNVDVMEIIDKFSIAFSKHEVLFEKAQKTSLPQRNNAYNEIAKELGLSSNVVVRTLIAQAKYAALTKMRRYVKVSLRRGNSGYDGIHLAPAWLKRLNKPFGLLEKAVKMETMTNPNSKNNLVYIKWELLRSAQLAVENGCGYLQPARELTEIDAVKHFAQAEQLDAELTKNLHYLWLRFYSQSMQKLIALIDVGDLSHRLVPIERLTVQEWRAADLALLYDTRLKVLRNDTLTCSITLQPLILLFKLMSEVKKLLDTNKTIDDLIYDQLEPKPISEVGHSQSPDENVDCGSKSNKETVDEVGEDMKSMRKYETAQVWALVYSEYKKRGCAASAVLLQKRWYELKQLTRMRVQATLAPLSSVPLLHALVKRFPCIVTENLLPWTTLVQTKHIYTDADLMRFKATSNDPNPVLKVCCRMNGKACSVDENYYSSDDDIEIIDQKKETITVYDSDDDQTKTDTDKQKSPDLIEKDNVTNSCIETLESFDRNKVKVKVILDDDSDSDNYDIEKLNAVIENAIRSNPKYNTILKDKNQSLDDGIYETISDIRSRLDFEENNIITKFEKDELNALSSVGEDRHDSVGDFNIKSERPHNFISDANEMCNNMELLDDEIKVESKSSSDDEGDGDEACDKSNGNDDESDTNGGRPHIDDKLVNLTHVVLTPVEYIYPWKLFSRNGTINCRRFSVRNFSRPVIVNSKQLSKCRPYIRQKQNGIKIGKIKEISKIPEYIRRKRKILTKYLRLSRTYFSAGFWNDENVALLEKCKPVCVRLKKGFRAVKKVELSDISEVRRINKTILTAQVAPTVIGQNRTLVINSYPSDANAQTVGMESSEPSKMTDDTPSSITPNNLVKTEPGLTSNHNQSNLPEVQKSVPQDKPNLETETRKSLLNTNIVPKESDEFLADESPSDTNIVPQENKEIVADESPTNTNLVPTENDELVADKIPTNTNLVPQETELVPDVTDDKNSDTNDGGMDNIMKEIYMKNRLPRIDKSLLQSSTTPSARIGAQFSEKQALLDNDMYKMAKYLLEKSKGKDLNKPNESEEKTKSSEHKLTSTRQTTSSLPSLPSNTSGVNEWLRQKKQNLQYFTLKPLSPPLTSSEKKEKKKKKKKSKEKHNKDTTGEINKGKYSNKSEKDSLKVNEDVLCNDSEDDEDKPLIINEDETQIVDQIESTDIDPVEKDKHLPSADNIHNNKNIENSLNICDTQSQNAKIVDPKTINIDKILDQIEKDKHLKPPTYSNLQNNEIIKTKENPINLSEYSKAVVVYPKLTNIGTILKPTENVEHLKTSTYSNDVHNRNNQIIQIKINPIINSENFQTEIIKPTAISILKPVEKHLTPSTDSNNVNIQNNETLERNLNICEHSRTEIINPKTIDIDKILDQVEKDKLLKPPIYSSQSANANFRPNNTVQQNEDDVIDLCDSNDEDNATDDVIPITPQTENDKTAPHINIRIVQNTIEINGQGNLEALKEKSETFLELVSKVAGKIKNNKEVQKFTANNKQTSNNPTVYYVVKTIDKSNANLQTDTHTDVHKPDEKSTGSNSQYRVIMIADDKNANDTVTNPIPDDGIQMPIIQSVLSLANQKFVENNMNKINSTSEQKATEIDNEVLLVDDNSKQENVHNIPPKKDNSIENAVKFDDSLIDSNRLLAPMKRRNSELMPIRSVFSCKRPRRNSIDDRQLYPVVVTSGPSRIMTERNSGSDENRLETEFCEENGAKSITAPDSPQPSTSSQNIDTL